MLQRFKAEMKRRQIFRSGRNALLAASGTSVLGACSIRRVSEQRSSGLPSIRWRMATSWPVSLDTIYGNAEAISQRVEQMSGGGFQIDTYAAGEIVPGLEVLDAVQSGSVECGHTASYYYIGKNPAFAFGTAVPFGLTASQQNAWLYYGGGLDAINDLYADFRTVSFPAGNTGAQMGGWFKKPVDSLSELKGVKMRIPGMGGKVMASLGVNVQVLPGGEIYLALDRGAIDAAEFTGPYDDEKLGLPQAAPYYYYPGWWEPGPTFSALVNRRAWEKLPSEYQAMFKTACAEANLSMQSMYDQRNSESLARLLKTGIKLQSFSNEILEQAQVSTADLLADLSSRDQRFRMIYEQWRSFQKQVDQWNNINELSLSTFKAKAG